MAASKMPAMPAKELVRVRLAGDTSQRNDELSGAVTQWPDSSHAAGNAQSVTLAHVSLHLPALQA
jgi:hypothetical protein